MEASREARRTSSSSESEVMVAVGKGWFRVSGCWSLFCPEEWCFYLAAARYV